MPLNPELRAVLTDLLDVVGEVADEVNRLGGDARVAPALRHLTDRLHALPTEEYP